MSDSDQLRERQPIRRWIIRDHDGKWIASVFADRYEIDERESRLDVYTGAKTGHFWIGDQIVGSASVDYRIKDSGGIMQKGV